MANATYYGNQVKAMKLVVSTLVKVLGGWRFETSSGCPIKGGIKWDIH